MSKVIGIDLNDVIRDYTSKFCVLYKKAIDKTFDSDKPQFDGVDFFSAFKATKMKLDEFMYVDYPYELYGCANTKTFNLQGFFNIWYSNLTDFDTPPEVVLISCGENETSIQSTLFFLSKIGAKVRKIFFPQNSKDAWELCDVMITANPKLIISKPDEKVLIKIKTPYNSSYETEYEYDSLEEIIKEDGEKSGEFKKLLELC